MRTVKADLHNHLKTGSDVSNLFRKTIDKAYSKLGKGGIVGLVNFDDRRYENFVSQLSYQTRDIGNAVHVLFRDILVVKGQEVSTNEGHLLVLGIEKDKHLKSGRVIEDTIQEAKDLNGIIIADHPFSPHGGLGPFLLCHQNMLSNFHGWEVHNGENALFRGANKKAWEEYKTLKAKFPALGRIVGSDGHSIYELGSSWMQLQMPSSYLSLDNTKLNAQLKESIKYADQYAYRAKSSVLGAIVHTVDLCLIVGASKIGLHS